LGHCSIFYELKIIKNLIIKHYYNIIIQADIRGSGASFGNRNIDISEREI